MKRFIADSREKLGNALAAACVELDDVKKKVAEAVPDDCRLGEDEGTGRSDDKRGRKMQPLDEKSNAPLAPPGGWHCS